MSRLDELINELCPDGVEYKKISEVCNISRGVVISKDDIRNNSGEYPVYSSQTENNGELGKINTYAYDGEYLTWTTDGANAGSVFYRLGKFSVTNVCGLLKVKYESLLTKYVYFVLSVAAPKYVNRGMGNPKLMSNVMGKIQIPLPPLPIQEEIVRILDNFTELTEKLTAELTAELTARKQQYEYYRDSLLTFGEEVEWKTLQKCTLKVNNIKWSENADKEFQYIDLSSVNRDDNKISETQCINSESAPSRAQQVVFNEDVIFGSTRPMLKRYCLINKDYHNQICSTGFCVLRANKEVVLPKWIFFIISSSDFYKHVEKYQKGASYPAISDREIKFYKIPAPPLLEQQRIVEILDRFDKLCNDMSEGLPAEIKAREQQYEYYRDKLLTFKEKEVYVDE